MLEENESVKLQTYFDKVAKAQGITSEEVIKTFETALKLVEEAPSTAGKPRNFVLSRAKAAMDGMFNNRKRRGEPFVFIPFGSLGDPRDWNSGEYTAIEAELKRGNVTGLIKEGKLMTMLVDGVPKPISRIISTEKVMKFMKGGKFTYKKGGKEIPFSESDKEVEPIEETIVTDGEVWVKGEGLPLFRDHRVFVMNRTNFNYSKKLGHRWEIAMVGIAWPQNKKEQSRLFETRIRYDQADPGNEKFFWRKYEPFKAYVENFEVNEKSSAWRYLLTSSRVTPKAAEVDLETLDIDIDAFLCHLHEEYDEKLGPKDCIPYYLDGLSDLKEYHDTAVRIDADGNKMKSPAGWDSMKWNQYAIVGVHVNGMAEPSGKASARYYLSDAALDHGMIGWSGKYIYKQPRKIPGRCLMMVKTAKGTTRYDRETRTAIYDEENADLRITVNSITSIADSIEMPDVEITGI